MTSRRVFLANTVALILSRQAVAQQPKVWRIGYLAPGLPEDALFFESFREGLSTLPNPPKRRFAALFQAG